MGAQRHDSRGDRAAHARYRTRGLALVTRANSSPGVQISPPAFQIRFTDKDNRDRAVPKLRADQLRCNALARYAIARPNDVTRPVATCCTCSALVAHGCQFSRLELLHAAARKGEQDLPASASHRVTYALMATERPRQRLSYRELKTAQQLVSVERASGQPLTDIPQELTDGGSTLRISFCGRLTVIGASRAAKRDVPKSARAKPAA